MCNVDCQVRCAHHTILWEQSRVSVFNTQFMQWSILENANPNLMSLPVVWAPVREGCGHCLKVSRVWNWWIKWFGFWCIHIDGLLCVKKKLSLIMLYGQEPQWKKHSAISYLTCFYFLKWGCTGISYRLVGLWYVTIWFYDCEKIFPFESILIKCISFGTSLFSLFSWIRYENERDCCSSFLFVIHRGLWRSIITALNKDV